MPVRHLNYTSRKKLERSDVQVLVRETDSGEHLLDLRLSLGAYDLPADAKVVAEAYRRTEWSRYSFGTVGLVRPSGTPVLKDFSDVDGLLFRVKVVAESNGRPLLVAEADRVKPVSEGPNTGAKETILPVVRGELGEELWVLDFSTGEPQLVINDAVEDWRGVPKLPFFRAAILPALLRMILVSILDEDIHDDEDLELWQQNWLQFAEALPGVDPRPSTMDEKGKTDWIDDAVRAFARAHQLKDQFLRLTE